MLLPPSEKKHQEREKIVHHPRLTFVDFMNLWTPVEGGEGCVAEFVASAGQKATSPMPYIQQFARSVSTECQRLPVFDGPDVPILVPVLSMQGTPAFAIFCASRWTCCSFRSCLPCRNGYWK